MIRPSTKNLIESLAFDIWPNPAAICDFGLDSQARYAAIKRAYVNGDVSAEQLDAALGDGPALTKLLNCGVVFQTAWDDLEDDSENEE